MISVTAASRYLKEDDTVDPMNATLVIPDKQVGAVMVVGTVTTRLNRLVRAVEQVERDRKKTARSEEAKRRHHERRTKAATARREATEERTRQRARRTASYSATRSSGAARSKGGGSGGGLLSSLAGGALGGVAGRSILSRALPLLGRVAGKLAAPLALVTGGYGVYSSVKDSGKADVLDAIAAGAGAGGITGSLFAGVGAVPGAIIGGLLGGASAIIYNSREAIAATYGQAKQYLGDLTDGAKEYAKDKWSSATKKMGEVSDYAKEKIGEAWESVKKTAAEYRDQVGEWLTNQGKTLREWFDSVTSGLRSAISLQSLRAMASEWLAALKAWFYNKFKFGGGSDSSSSGGNGGNGGGGANADSSYGGGPQNPPGMYAPGSGGYAGGGIARGGVANWNTSGGVGRGYSPTNFVQGGEYGYAPKGSQGEFGVGGVQGGTSDIGTIGRGGFGLSGPSAEGGDRLSRPDANVPRLGRSDSTMPQFWQNGARLGAPGEQTQRPAGSLVFPVTGSMGNEFGHWRGGGRAHAGIDLRAPNGSPVMSSVNGRVLSAEYHRGYGNTIEILGDDGKVYRYGVHEGAMNIAPGSRVAAGQNIGTVGAGHVHHEVMTHDEYKRSPYHGYLRVGGGAPPGLIDPGKHYGIKPGSKIQAGQPANTATQKQQAVEEKPRDTTPPPIEKRSFTDYAGMGKQNQEDAAPAKATAIPEKEKDAPASSVKEKDPPPSAPAEREDTPDASIPTSASGIKGKRVSIDDIPTVHPNVHLAMVGASDKA